MSFINEYSRNKALKKHPFILEILFFTFLLFGSLNLGAQVGISDTTTLNIDCFDISDFSEDDLFTFCEEGFDQVAISLVNPADCPLGIQFVNYSGTTLCGDEFSVDRMVNIFGNFLNAVLTVGNVPLTCRDDVNPQVSDVTVLSSCGEVEIQIEEIIGDEEVDICQEHVRSFRYTITDNCSTIELTRDFTITPEPITLNVGETFTRLECAEDINVTEDDFIINLPCGAEVINVNFSAPDLTAEDASCNNEFFEFRWEVETTCGNFNARKSFRISNGGATITLPEDITISCDEHPLSDAALLEGVSVEEPCENYPDPSPLRLFRPSEELPERFSLPETYNYQYIVTDACTGSDEEVIRRVTVLPEGPTIEIDEPVTIVSDLGFVNDQEFILEGVTAIAGCCEINSISPSIFSTIIDSSSLTSFSVVFRYIADDVCGNTATAFKEFQFIPAVSLIEEEVMVECFNLDDFSEADLTTLCEEGFANVVVSLVSMDAVGSGLPMGCCVGTVFVNYSGITACGDEFSLTQQVDISNPGLSASIPDDITISCADGFAIPTADDVTANSPCGGVVNVEVEELANLSEPCFDRTRTFRFTVSDDCETILLTQNILVTQTPLILDVGPTDVTVECVDEISVIEGDIDIQLPCDAEILDILFTEPDLADPLASCDDEIHEFSWQVITTCSSMSITKTFHVINEGITEVENVTISCVDYPLDADEFVDLALRTSCGIDFNAISSFAEIGGSLEEICAETEVTYQVFATDDCGNTAQVVKTVTVLPELPTITFDEEETTITCIEQLEDEDFLLQGVNIESPCSSVEPSGIQVNPFVTDPGEEESCNGVIVNVGYEVFDECGNSAEASKTFIVNNPDFSIEVAPDENIQCLFDIEVSPNDVTVNDACGIAEVTPDFNIIEIHNENDGCPGESVTVDYAVILSCGSEIVVSRVFTILDSPLIPVLNDTTLRAGATINFSCADEPLIDMRFNESTVFFQPFECFDPTVLGRVAFPLVTNFEKVELPIGNCEENGFLRQFQFNWTAEDECGRTGSFTVFANVADNQAPTLLGLPSDVTINCEEELPEAPVVIAEDDCGQVDVELTEEMGFVVNGALKQKIITRTWSSTDECGNNTTEVRTITIVDEEAPVLSFINEEGIEIVNGEEIIVECDEDFGWLFDLDKNDISATDNCGCLHPEFELKILYQDEAKTKNLKQLIVPQWTLSDEFGNISEFSFSVFVLDTKAPTFAGTDTLFICEDNVDGFAYALDACGSARTSFVDYAIKGSPKEVFRRRIDMVDRVGNYGVFDQIVVDCSGRPDLIEFNQDFNLSRAVFTCTNDQPNITPFSKDNVSSLFEGFFPVEITFEEIIYPSKDSSHLLEVELRWIGSTPCGYADTITETVFVIDETAPSFQSFEKEVTVDCITSVPRLVASDACGLSEISFDDQVQVTSCGNSQEIIRVYEAIDISGNISTATQYITVIDTLGPVFNEPVQICSEEITDDVYAIDPCSNEKILAETISDSLVYDCGNNSVYVRTMVAEDACGNETVFTQEVYKENFNLEIGTVDEFLSQFANKSSHDIASGDHLIFNAIFNLDAEDVIAQDSCGNFYEASYERKVIEYGICENNYEYSFVLSWDFIEICGITHGYEVQFNVLKEEVYIEPVIEVFCEQDLPKVKIHGLPQSINYMVEVDDLRDEHGEGTVVRTVHIPYYCGESLTLVQHIHYKNGFSAKIVGENNPRCDGYSVPYALEIEGGEAPYEIVWSASELCEIEPSETMTEATVYFTEPETILKAMVTDATGCRVVCEAKVTCSTLTERSSSEGEESKDFTIDLSLVAHPNPFIDVVEIETQAPIYSPYSYAVYNHLGQLKLQSHGKFDDGTSIHLNMHHLSSGIYYITVFNEGQKETLKIIKI